MARQGIYMSKHGVVAQQARRSSRCRHLPQLRIIKSCSHHLQLHLPPLKQTNSKSSMDKLQITMWILRMLHTTCWQVRRQARWPCRWHFIWKGAWHDGHI